MDSVALVAFASALPGASIYLRWYVRRYADRGGFPWWQKPFMAVISATLLSFPFQIGSRLAGEFGGNPQTQPFGTFGALMAVFGVILWCGSEGFRDLLVSLLAGRLSDSAHNRRADTEPAFGEAGSPLLPPASDRLQAPDRAMRL